MNRKRANVVDKKRACEYQKRACLYHFANLIFTRCSAPQQIDRMYFFCTGALLKEGAKLQGSGATAIPESERVRFCLLGSIPFLSYVTNSPSQITDDQSFCIPGWVIHVPNRTDASDKRALRLWEGSCRTVFMHSRG